MDQKIILAIAGVLSTVIIGVLVTFLYWVGNNVVDLKTDTAVITVKVEENHKMLSVLWDDFLEKRNGNLARLDVKASK
tara:strand:- start:4348 stop:4581 length:234 start_codon:yes stop_codon:yes gene_type:complete